MYVFFFYGNRAPTTTTNTLLLYLTNNLTCVILYFVDIPKKITAFSGAILLVCVGRNLQLVWAFVVRENAFFL